MKKNQFNHLFVKYSTRSIWQQREKKKQFFDDLLINYIYSSIGRVKRNKLPVLSCFSIKEWKKNWVTCFFFYYVKSATVINMSLLVFFSFCSVFLLHSKLIFAFFCFVVNSYDKKIIILKKIMICFVFLEYGNKTNKFKTNYWGTFRKKYRL